MSVVVIAEGLPTVDVMRTARSLATALSVPLRVYGATGTGSGHQATGNGPSQRQRQRGSSVAEESVEADAPPVADRRSPIAGFPISGLSPFSADAWVAAFEPLLRDEQPLLVLVADGAHTRAFFPALAAELARPLLSGVTRVRVVAGQLEVERPLHQGLATERLVVRPPLFVTLVSAGVPDRAPLDATEVPATTAGRDRVTRVLPPDPDTVDLSAAERIVAGGLGLGSKEALGSIATLAKSLGAAVGGTRVISDRGWLEHERYIGSTGKTVAPKLYLALGISGASQHLVGMTGAETIVAVNTDRAAPIFGVADLGIVGDLHPIVRELQARLDAEAK